MKCVFVWDDAQLTDHAYNLYACPGCGMVLKHDLWQDAGKRWLMLNGRLEGGTPAELYLLEEHVDYEGCHPLALATSLEIAAGLALRLIDKWGGTWRWQKRRRSSDGAVWDGWSSSSGSGLVLSRMTLDVLE